MSEPLIVDARWQPPPLPMEMTLDALDDLPEDGELLLLIHREPGPLYSILAQNGYTHATEIQSDGTFCIRIRHASP
ncbi:MAG: DUF2249 domain-containing protein [Rhodocyclaceae bacterium]|nr:DUF2249 domain-containing protein [Rhodocyclaceae bacterium]